VTTVIHLGDGTLHGDIGNKAKALVDMKKNGFNVPNGIVIPSIVYSEIMKESQIGDRINSALCDLHDRNIPETSREIQRLLETVDLPAAVIGEIAASIDTQKRYAVRSSALKEDLDNHSFAGQYNTYLNVSGLEGMRQAIINCYKSMYSEASLAYLVRHDVGADDMGMAIIIQEMVDADVSGVAFTVNPVTGADKEIVIEVGTGLGEDIVGGRVLPERYLYNWYDEKCEENAHQLLDDEMLSEMAGVFLKIQTHYGYPCDIEYAVKDRVLYILQARPITKIMYSGIADQWTTADFKDGGVSATVCRPFMWSLYEYVWEICFRDYLNKALLIRRKHMKKLGEMFYGRPYWNLTKAKLGMAKVPGYVERNFDSELGIEVPYEGNGTMTQANLISLVNVARIYLVNRKYTAHRLESNDAVRNELLDVYDTWLSDESGEQGLCGCEKAWQELVFTYYLRSESVYFSQIFTNMIGQAIYKGNLKKYVSESAYLNLLTGLQDISHLRPFNDIWSISRMIRSRKEACDYWATSPVSDIADAYHEETEEHFLPQVRDHINKYGYHSDRELDVAYPHYAEDPVPVIASVKETVLLSDENNPVTEQAKQNEAYREELKRLAGAVSGSKYKSLVKQIEEMRTMLWWREELRDISTRYYYLVRLWTMKLARHYAEEKVIHDADDMWYLKIGDVRRYINKEIGARELRDIIAKNKNYYLSFRNFTSENEIGNAFDRKATVAMSDGLKGTGCNNGVVTGVARVVCDFSEIGKIQPGDILITKYTDTGWTSKFAILKGIVTEYGGTLCHAAIVSREYGIPCIVGAVNATKLIKDGSRITIDGATGAIEVMEDR